MVLLLCCWLAFGGAPPRPPARDVVESFRCLPCVGKIRGGSGGGVLIFRSFFGVRFWGAVPKIRSPLLPVAQVDPRVPANNSHGLWIISAAGERLRLNFVFFAGGVKSEQEFELLSARTHEK